MTAYIWLVVLLLLTALLMGGNVKGNKKYIFVAFILMFCIIGLRDVYTIGCDSASSYLHAFERMANTSWGEVSGRGDEDYNLGFAYLMKLGYIVTNGNYQLFIALISAFMMIAHARFVGKYSPDPLQSVLYFLGLLHFTFLFDALKQAIAMSILLFAFDAILEKKPGKFIILTLLAAWFHFPALVFLPAYWIGRMKVDRSFLILLAILLGLTFVFRDAMLKLMLGAYGGDDLDTTMEGVKFLRNKAIIMLIIIVAALVLRPIDVGDTVYTTLLKFAGIAVVFQTFCGYNNIFERLADYYFQYSIVLIPLVFEKCDLKKHYLEPGVERLAKTVAPAVFCAFAIWRFLGYVDGNTLLSPFRFFFQSTIQ